MTKKQRNRKLVSQNARNRMLNRYYRSTIKTLLKSFFKKSKNSEKTENTNQEIKSVSQTLFSLLDKASNKKVIHKNKAARKKSKISRILNSFSVLQPSKS